MFEWATIHQMYHGRNYYANANPAIGNDSNPGTDESPFLTIARLLSECRPGAGDRAWAYSSKLHIPALGLYAFTENVVLDKENTALIGHFAVVVNSGIGIQVHNPAVDLNNCLVSGASVHGDGLDVGYRIKNCSRTLLVRCEWLLGEEDPGQVGFELTADPASPNLEAFGGNGFIHCGAFGGRIGGGVNKTTGFKLTDYGLDSNYLLDCLIAKNEVGIDVINSSTHGDHAAANCRFYDNDIPCIQADSLHHLHLFSNVYDDIVPGFSGWGKQLPWPNEEADWDFAHPDPAPISNIGAFFANKMGTISSTSMIRDFVFSHINSGGFGTTP